MSARIDPDDLQGNILRPYRFPVSAHLLLRVGDVDEGRLFVDRVAARVTSAAEWVGDKPPCTVNVAVTWAGLAALGVGERILDAFPLEFRQGMAARAGQLGDTAASAPAYWDNGLGTGEAHVLISVQGQSTKVLHATVHSLLAGAGDSIRVVHVQNTQRLPGDREHFGFRDGIGQPAVQGMPPKPGRGHARPRDRRGDPSPSASSSSGIPLSMDGSRPARRRPSIATAPSSSTGSSSRTWPPTDVSWPARGRTFRAARRCWPPSWWAGGLTAHRSSCRRTERTRRSPPTPSASTTSASDPIPGECGARSAPTSAGPIRRDGLGFHGSLVNRHRIIRRGVPYGPALPEGEMEPDGIERGVLFYAFNASFARQFEFIQSTWLNDGNALGLGTDRDPVAGSWPETEGPDKMIVPGGPPRFVAPLPSLVTTKGGEYLWMPGLAALRAICGPLR